MIEIKSCPYCQHTEKELLGKQTHTDKYLELVDSELNKVERFWYKCSSCDFVYRTPMISNEEAQVLYSKYRNFEFRKITPDDYFDKMTTIPEIESETYAKAKFIKENIQNIQSILDVGCGGGIFLYQLNKLFPKCELLGLEPNSDYAQMVRGKLKIEIVEDFYKVGNINKAFDLTVSTDVIEHIHDINVFWEAARTNVHSGKYLFVEVPNIDNFKVLEITHDVFESPHLYFFSNKHVIAIANKHGFDLVGYKKVINRKSKDWYIFQKKIIKVGNESF